MTKFFCDSFFVITMITASISIEAEELYNCDALDPRVELSSGAEGKIKANIESVFKVGEVEAEASGKISQATQNIQKDFPLSERANATNRLLYLLCEMISKEKIDPERKFSMYLVLLDRMSPPAPAAVLPVTPSTSSTEKKAERSPSTKSSTTTQSRPEKNQSAAQPSINTAKTKREPVPQPSQPIAPAQESNRSAFFSGKKILVTWSPVMSKRVQPIRFIFSLADGNLVISGIYIKMTQSPELSDFFSKAPEKPRGTLIFLLHDEGALVGRAEYCCWKNIQFYPNHPSVFNIGNDVVKISFPFNTLDTNRNISLYYDLLFVRGDAADDKRFDSDINSKNIWALIDSGTILQ
jgi:hypothetical protein